MIPTQDEIKAMHNGLISCPLNQVRDWMPEISPILNYAPLDDMETYYVDAKVHMLMPNQYPCIPNWHGDMIPRDSDGNLMPEKCDLDKKLFLWLSGAPLTEFKDGREIVAGQWTTFNQLDIPRGVKSEDFQWRLFIRIAPASLVTNKRSGRDCLRRHSQVYLDANNFTW